MKNLIRSNIPFLGPYFVFLIGAGLILFSYPKPDIHRYINEHYHPVLDWVFRFFTWVGDGLTGVGVALILLSVSYRNAILASLSMLLAAGITQLLKLTIFNGEPRPFEFFSQNHLAPLRQVPGVDNMLFDSFPSGHTTQAFALCLSLTFFTENRWLKFFLFITAFCIGYSRMYLSQHFLRDVFAGSLVGSLTTMIVFVAAAHFRWPSDNLHYGFLSKNKTV